MSVKNNKQKVALGEISGVWVVDKFHFKFIPKFWYKVDVTIVHLCDVALMYPYEAWDPCVVKDVVGSCTLWDARNLKAT